MDLPLNVLASMITDSLRAGVGRWHNASALLLGLERCYPELLQQICPRVVNATQWWGAGWQAATPCGMGRLS